VSTEWTYNEEEVFYNYGAGLAEAQRAQGRHFTMTMPTKQGEVAVSRNQDWQIRYGRNPAWTTHGRYETWASSEVLLARIQRRLGPEPGEKLWTYGFAREVADSVAELVWLLEVDLRQAYAGGKPGRPQLGRSVPPEQVVPDDPRLRRRCRACRNGIVRLSPQHSREPNECKYPLDEDTSWECPACRAGRASTGDHSLIPGECRMMEERYSGRGARGPSHARDPRVLASGASDSGARSWPRHDVAEGEEEPRGPPAAPTPPLRPPEDGEELPEFDLPEGDSTLGPAEGEGDEIEPREPIPRRRFEDAAAHVDTGADWTQWDIGKAMQDLRSMVPGKVQTTLRRIHVRLWHAPAQRLGSIVGCGLAGIDCESGASRSGHMFRVPRVAAQRRQTDGIAKLHEGVQRGSAV